MSRPSSYIPRKSPRGPERVECTECGRDSGLTRFMTIRSWVARLRAAGWMPSQSGNPGGWVCPECAGELNSSLEEAVDD